MDACVNPNERWRDLDMLLCRAGNLVGPGFEPGPELREFIQSDGENGCGISSYERQLGDGRVFRPRTHA